LEQADERQFLDICHGKQCCPGDQSISTLTKGVVSNNVNGPGSPSSRVYLFTIQTSAPSVHEVMSLKTSADIGQTLSGGFRLHFNTCGVLVVQETFCREFSTPFLTHDISAIGLKSKMEASLNPSSRLKQIDRSGTPIGIGTVEVTRERLGTSGGFHWKRKRIETSVSFIFFLLFFFFIFLLLFHFTARKRIAIMATLNDEYKTTGSVQRVDVLVRK
jgi:hypothetical protein